MYTPITPNSGYSDVGPSPLIFNLEQMTSMNTNFRTVLWTGNHLQITVMCINPGEEIGIEMHDNLDQFLRIEQGNGLVKMGFSKDALDCTAQITPGYAITVPAGTWHNVINNGATPLKLYSIYAPTQHPKGTVHRTKEDAEH